MTTLKLRIEKGKLRMMQQSIPKKGEMLPSVYSTIKSQLSIFNFILIFSALLSACTDVSDVTDPDSREDIASWYKDDGIESSSSVAAPSSSSVEIPFSSSVAVPSSSSVEIPFSSSVAVPSSSSVEIPSSSSVAAPSSSSVAASYAYTNWSTCVADGYCGTFADTRETPANNYKWVIIGTQTWMAENLAYLPSVNTKTDYSSTVAKYYVYNNNSTIVSTAKASSYYTSYGVLYNWTAAGSACPSGWHLPSSAEWDELEAHVGGSATAGTYLKATSDWTSTSGISNVDTYGFSALPGGYYGASDFYDALNYGYWWTAKEYDAMYAYPRSMTYGNAYVYSYHNYKDYGFSVRCVK